MKLFLLFVYLSGILLYLVNALSINGEDVFEVVKAVGSERAREVRTPLVE